MSLRLFAFRCFGALGGGTSNLLCQASLPSRVSTRQVLRSRSSECQVFIVFPKPTGVLLSRHVLPHTPSINHPRYSRRSNRLIISDPYYKTTALTSIRPYAPYKMSSSNLKRGGDHLADPAVDSKKPKANGSITSFFGAPKSKAPGLGPVKSPAGAAASPVFNKQKWVATLSAEQKELLDLEINTMHESWLAHLKDEIVKPEFLALKRFLQKEKQSGTKIFPPEDDIYSWYGNTMCSLQLYRLI